MYVIFIPAKNQVEVHEPLPKGVVRGAPHSREMTEYQRAYRISHLVLGGLLLRRQEGAYYIVGEILLSVLLLRCLQPWSLQRKIAGGNASLSGRW